MLYSRKSSAHQMWYISLLRFVEPSPLTFDLKIISLFAAGNLSPEFKLFVAAFYESFVVRVLLWRLLSLLSGMVPKYLNY